MWSTQSPPKILNCWAEQGTRRGLTIGAKGIQIIWLWQLKSGMGPGIGSKMISVVWAKWMWTASSCRPEKPERGIKTKYLPFNARVMSNVILGFRWRTEMKRKNHTCVCWRVPADGGGVCGRWNSFKTQVIELPWIGRVKHF